MKAAVYSGMVMPCLAAVLIGCVTAKAPRTPRASWTSPEKPSVTVGNDATWASIQKQSPDYNQPLTLADLIDLALHNSPDTLQAWESARAAEAQLTQAKSKYYPQAQASGSATIQKTDASIPDGNYLGDRNLSPKATLSWLLLDLGGRRATVERANLALISLNYSYNKSLQDLLLSVEIAYYGLYSARSSVDAAEADLENSKRSLEAAQQRLDAGVATRLDVLQSQSSYDLSLYNLEDAKGSVKTAQGTLAQAVGLAADTRFDIAMPTNDAPAQIADEDIASLIERSLDRRPDVASMRASVQSKASAVQAANSDLWPSLNLGASAQQTRHDYSGTAPSDTLNDSDYLYSGYLSLQWNFFDGFYNLGAKRAAQAQLDLERAKLKATEIGASSDVWTKYYGLKTASQKLVFSRAFADSSDASYKLALEGYNAGLKSILDLLKAQSDLADARSKLIVARKGVWTALADLAHATGALDVPPLSEVKESGGK